MKPLIGIPAEIIHQPSAVVPQYAQNTSYIDAIHRSGGLPIVLPPSDNTTSNVELYKQLDGFLLPGGIDIDESNPGLQDRFEAHLARWAIDHDVPLLGICRGMQMIDLVQGGSLIQDIPTEFPEALDHRLSKGYPVDQPSAHTIRIDPDSMLAQQLDAECIEINEYHHQAVKDIGQGLVATAWTDDGIIEAIEGVESGYIMGIQCHPEALSKKAETRWQSVFDAFIATCRETAPSSQLSVRGLIAVAKAV